MSRRKIMYCVVALHKDGITVRVFGTFQSSDKARGVAAKLRRIAKDPNSETWRIVVRHVFDENDGTLALAL